jgi:pilus assembly protein CpaB
VDVVLTPDTSNGQGSQTILQNVRVLAINSQLGETGTTGQTEESDEQEKSAQTFSDEVIVTLELDQERSEIIISATKIGELSLVLRSMTDFSQSGKIAQQGANQAIRLTSPFWTQTSAQASLR